MQIANLYVGLGYKAALRPSGRKISVANQAQDLTGGSTDTRDAKPSTIIQLYIAISALAVKKD